MTHNELSYNIIRCAIEVHSKLGSGLLESVYETCFASQMRNSGLKVLTQVHTPVIWNGEVLEKSFFIDILVNDMIIVEVKSVETILPVHEHQLLTYLKLSGLKLGLLINFNMPVLTSGIRRKINGTL